MKMFVAGKVVGPVPSSYKGKKQSGYRVRFGILLGRTYNEYTAFDFGGEHMWNVACALKDGMSAVVAIDVYADKEGRMRDKVIDIFPLDAEVVDKISSVILGAEDDLAS